LAKEPGQIPTTTAQRPCRRVERIGYETGGQVLAVRP
jgi:hypothetical protein